MKYVNEQFDDLMGGVIETEDKWLNNKLNSHICYGKGGGGGGQQQQDVPPTLRPYVQQVLNRASIEYGPQKTYQPYYGERVVGFTQPELAAQQGILRMAGERGLVAADPSFTTAATYYDPALGALRKTGDVLSRQQFLAGLSGQALEGTTEDIARQRQALEEGRQRFLAQEEMIGATAPLLSTAEQRLGEAGELVGEAGAVQRAAARDIGREEVGRFGLTGADIQQYMDPYQQAVIDIEKRQAMQDAAQTAQAIGAKAAGMGAFGGSRQAILEAQAASDLGTRLADIQARGQQRAYQQALQTAAQQQQVGLAQAAQQRQREAGLGAALSGLGQQQQQLGIGGFGALAQQGLGTAQALGGVGQQLAGLGGQFANVASTRAGLSQALGGVGQQLGGVGSGLGALSQAYGGLGQQALGQGYRELGYVSGVGEAQRGIGQQRADIAFQEFGRQRDFPSEQLQRFSSLIQGFPYQITMPGVQPSGFQQAVGGLTAIGGIGRGLGFFSEGGDVGKKKLTDLSGDGKITQKDVLIGRGVIEAKTGGGLSTVYKQTGGPAGRSDVLAGYYRDLFGLIQDRPKFDREKEEERLRSEKGFAIAELGANILAADPSRGALAAIGSAAPKSIQQLTKLTREQESLDEKERTEQIKDLLSQVTIYEKLQEAEKTAREAALGGLDPSALKDITDTEYENIETAVSELQNPAAKIVESLRPAERQSLRTSAAAQAESEYRQGLLGDAPIAFSRRLKEIYQDKLLGLGQPVPVLIPAPGAATGTGQPVAGQTINTFGSLGNPQKNP